MRKLSVEFMKDLIKNDGVLHPILNRVQKDHTLMLAIRENYVNIYYRGGNILKITERNRGDYQTFFDEKYNKSNLPIKDSPVEISKQKDANLWVESFSDRKNIMDEYFSKDPNAEREFQQLIARENNNSTISSESEYFISDIEFTEPYGRFDIVAFKWLASQRKNGSNCVPALIEMKYGDGSLGGSAGLLKHLQDMDKLFSSEENSKSLYETMESQFGQLDQLGLLNFNKGTSNARVTINRDEIPEVIFILANHNPRSSKLKTILSDPEFDKYAQSDLFDLKFYVASFAGYGLHAKCMLPLTKFRAFL